MTSYIPRGRGVLSAACFLALVSPAGSWAQVFPPFPNVRSFLDPQNSSLVLSAPRTRRVVFSDLPESILPIFGNLPAGGKASLDGWKIKEWSGLADVQVVQEEIGAAIHLKSAAASTALIKELSFQAQDYPILHWRWKALQLPRGGDVRRKETDDQAIQLYVAFPYRWPATLYSKVVGYIWDSNAPVGTIVTSPKSSNVRYIVVRSGVGDLGRWLPEERNLLEDYRALFGQEPPKASGVSIMIDSNDTKSFAESFIGDLYLASKASP